MNQINRKEKYIDIKTSMSSEFDSLAIKISFGLFAGSIAIVEFFTDLSLQNTNILIWSWICAGAVLLLTLCSYPLSEHIYDLEFKQEYNRDEGKKDNNVRLRKKSERLSAGITIIKRISILGIAGSAIFLALFYIKNV